MAAATNGYWKPGTQRGRPVNVKYNLPINFALN
ncbi:MAG: energy transducer TonB [Rudanella sp.]|nr:energy transducer TonB [Rudanella sp.]